MLSSKETSVAGYESVEMRCFGELLKWVCVKIAPDDRRF